MPEPTRKLAAIVFTDIVGFTKLTAEDQSKASSLLKTQRELFQPLVAQFNGSWIKEMGDGLILTFDTAINSISYCLKC
jgi:class 3 adenylate cyclase